MTAKVDIDSVDEKILRILISDARASLKDIAKESGISSVAVLNRIKRLKRQGVITGATLFPTINLLGFQIVATIGIETDSNTDAILDFLNKHTYLIEPSSSVGEYDLCAVVYAEDIASLNEKTEAIRTYNGVRKVVVNVWSGVPHSNFDNIDLNPNRKR